jgi:hypothetical protein
MTISTWVTKHGSTRVSATGADAKAFIERMTRPIGTPIYAFADTLSAFDDLTAAARRQRLTSTPAVRTSARAAL